MNTYDQHRLYYFLTHSIYHRIQIHRRFTQFGTFEFCVPTHVVLRTFIMQVLASQLHFLANRNIELAFSPLFWQVDCKNTAAHVALLSDLPGHVLFFGIYHQYNKIKLNTIHI